MESEMRRVFLITFIALTSALWGIAALAEAPNELQPGVDDFEPIPFQWTEINPTLPGGLPGSEILFNVDPYAGPFDLGFDFPFYDCDTYDATYVYYCGFSSFTSIIAFAYANAPIPSSTEPNNILAIYWDDLYWNPNTSVWCYPDSTNTRFIIEWYQMQHISGGGIYTFESILYPNGAIEYYYHTIEDGPINSCTIGIENITGTMGIQATYNGSGPFEPLSQTAIRFNPECIEPVDDLAISFVGTGFHDILLIWSPTENAMQYHIYKSSEPYSGFTIFASTTDTMFTDTDAIIGGIKSFYYVTSDNAQ